VRSCEQIEEVIFSPDSRHLASKAMENGKWVVFLDDNKGAEYNLVSNLIFSPDGSQLIYSALKNNRRLIVKNKEEITGGMATLAPLFSPDGSRFAFLLAEKNNKFHYVIDGKQGLPVDSPGRLIFSNDGTSTAYAAGINGKWHIIKDGVKGPAFKKIYAFSFSPTTNDILYAADNDEGKTCVVMNDVPGKFYDSIGVPVYSPDGKRYGYAAMQGEKEMFMIINTEEQPGRYPIIGIPAEEKSGKTGFAAQQPFFSLKGNRFAYPVYDPVNKTAFMVVDGKPQSAFDAIMQPIFSDDEKHVAYMAKKGKDWRLVVDGQPGALTCEGMIRGATIAFDALERCFFVLVANQTDTGLSFFRLEAKIKEPS
jgi:Tol biopolymer transport system component